MAPSFEEHVQELTRKMWRKKFFAIIWEGRDADLRSHLVAHLEYMIGLEREGKLFASGPLDLGRSSDGLTVVRVDTIAEARAIALNDPFVINGIRSFRIREWILMEGSFAVTVNFSDRSTHIE